MTWSFAFVATGPIAVLEWKRRRLPDVIELEVFRGDALPFMQAGSDAGDVAGIEEGAEFPRVRQRLEFERIEVVRIFGPPIPPLLDDSPGFGKCPSASSTRRCLSGHNAMGSSFPIAHA